VKGPDFDALVGEGLEPDERERLHRVHELLVAAGPPPDLGAEAPVVPLRSRRRRGALMAVAAALAVAAFAVGALVGERAAGRDVDFEETMQGAATAPGASASLIVFELDEAGNWPMELEVQGLPPARSGRPYELWLTRGGKPAALCGSFLTSADGTAAVPMNAPYNFEEFDGWVVVEEGTERPVLTT
jgi:hypothetical protein